MTDRLCREALERWLPSDGPAVAVGIAQDGSPGATAFAHADAETAFYLASVSKVYLGLWARTLCAAGILDPEADIHERLPELRVADPISTRQLAEHSAGVRDHYALLSLTGSPAPADRQAAVDLLLAQSALNFPPGTRSGYSNGGYVLLEEVCRRAAGHGLDTWWAESVAGPLGLSRSGYPGPLTMTPGLSRAGSGELVPAPYSYATIGDGGLISTLGDLLEVEAALQRGEFGRYASVATLDGEPAAISHTDRYAWGMCADDRRVWHGGIVEGYRTHLLRVPAARLSIVVLAADSTASVVDCADSLAAALLDDPGLFRPATGGTDPFGHAILATGSWRLPDGTTKLAVADGYGLDVDGIHLDPAPGRLATLPGISPTFTSANGSLSWGEKPCEREPFTPTAADRLPAGHWVCDDLDNLPVITATGEVSVAGLSLPADPVAPGVWVVAGSALLEKSADGFSVTLPRLRRLPMRPARENEPAHPANGSD